MTGPKKKALFVNRNAEILDLDIPDTLTHTDTQRGKYIYIFIKKRTGYKN